MKCPKCKKEMYVIETYRDINTGTVKAIYMCEKCERSRKYNDILLMESQTHRRY